MTKESAAVKKKLAILVKRLGRKTARLKLIKAKIGFSTAYSLVNENYHANLRPETCKKVLKAIGG